MCQKSRNCTQCSFDIQFGKPKYLVQIQILCHFQSNQCSFQSIQHLNNYFLNHIKLGTITEYKKNQMLPFCTKLPLRYNLVDTRILSESIDSVFKDIHI